MSRPPRHTFLSNSQVEIEEDAECPVNQVDQPKESERSPVCFDEQVIPSVDEHQYTKVTEGTAPSRAQDKWVVVLC